MSAAFAHEPCQWYGSKATSAALNMSVMILVSSSLSDISYIGSTQHSQASATAVALADISYVSSIHRHKLRLQHPKTGATLVTLTDMGYIGTTQVC